MEPIAIFKKDYIIGLDIGSSSVKIAQFIKKEDGLYLVKAGLKEIKTADDNTSRDKEVTAALKDLLKGVDVKRSEVILNVNCPMTALKKLTVPYMPKAELRDGLRLEAKNYFPFPISDAFLDFEILGDVVEKGVRRYEVVVSASPKATVDKYLSLLKAAGIKPASFVPCPYTLQKLAELAYSPDEDAKEEKTKCLIDIGEVHTELTIFKGRDLMFSRKIPVAGIDFTKALTGVLVSDKGKTELSLDEAEKIKRDIGIPTESESKIIEDKISTSQILSMMRTPLENLVSEIERCFDYYREETGGGKVDKIILFGGGASLGGLIKYLSEGLGIEVKLGNPLEGLKIDATAIPDKDRVSYRLGAAIGAGLSGAKGINLLPPEIKEEIKRTFKRATIQAVVTAIILISVLVYIGMKIQLGNFQKRISVAELELSSLQFQLKKAEAHHLAHMVLVDEPYWGDIFKELSNIIPDYIHLTEMNMEEDGGIIMKGIAASEDGEQLLSDFMIALEDGIFRSVKLVRTKDLSEKAGNEFELKCWVD